MDTPAAHNRDNRHNLSHSHSCLRYWPRMHHWWWEGCEEPEGLNQTFSWWKRRYTHHHPPYKSPSCSWTQSDLTEVASNAAPFRSSFLTSLNRKTGTLVLFSTACGLDELIGKAYTQYCIQYSFSVLCYWQDPHCTTLYYTALYNHTHTHTLRSACVYF